MQFLKYVAEDLRRKYQNDLSRVCVVFPNKRAGIFFDDYLLQSGDEAGAVWSPQYLTIQELFDSLSDMQSADEIKAVCLLYEIYRSKMQEEGKDDISLDFFYGWGRQLLTDFSDVDRSMVDASELFGSWSAARQLERMSDEERSQLSAFLEMLKGTGRLIEDFEHLWSQLYDIYQELNTTLAQDSEAYEGARQRRVVEGLKNNQRSLPERYDVYAFVGFNLLLPVEWQLFAYLQQEEKALFYWDYDKMYVEPGSRFSFGETMKRNLRQFPNELPENLFDHLAHLTEVEYVAAPSDTAQTAFATDWLKRNLTAEEKRTAVVLCDELLLQPMVHGLPENVKEVNITKGFPMTHTLAYAFVNNCLNHDLEEAARSEMSNEDVLKGLSEQLRNKARSEMEHQSEQTWLGQLTAESYFQCYTTVNRFLLYVSDGVLQVSLRTLQGLLRQVLGTLSIPFHGEPASGLQVMGMLETRNLDFDHLLMLSVGEGIVPKKTADRSFIPYDLRKYYHIMTGDERSDVYAYNFFRLLQRTKRVSLVYNASTDGERRCGEMSRFMLRILIETRIPVRFTQLNFKSSVPNYLPEEVSEEDARRLMETRPLNLSVSALEQYLDCPMKYFFSHLLRIKDLPHLDDILPANTFGSIFHRAAELIYESFRTHDEAVKLDATALRSLADNVVRLSEFVVKAFQDVSEEDARLNPSLSQAREGRQLYTVEEHEAESEVIKGYLQRFLRYDASLAASPDGLTFVKAEECLRVRLDSLTEINGKIDRIDVTQKDGKRVYRIVDYKTGSYDKEKMRANGFEKLFHDHNKGYVLQTFYYRLMYQLQYGKLPEPALYYTQKVGAEDFSPYVSFKDDRYQEAEPAPEELLADFREHLETEIHLMRTSSFCYAQDATSCRLCRFGLLCLRGQ